MVDHLVCKSYKYHRGGHTIAKELVDKVEDRDKNGFFCFCIFQLPKLYKTVFFKF
jgi:hypothetical protein